ncbi:MAG: trypsin-like peptidase domain-containing protein [Clostridia bacterium]|nr:trypsin-like peptidase domain-containing protein [Clostridia bacterium]
MKMNEQPRKPYSTCTYRPNPYFRVILAVLSLILFILPFAGSAEEAEDNSGEVIIMDEQTLTGEMSPGTEVQPFIPEDVEQDRTIFGYDDRVTVKNPKNYPFSAIAYMEVHAGCGCKWTGSGFMVGEDRLMTAAHCLVCSDHSEWADQITFYFGYKSKNNYACKYNSRWTAYVGNTFPNRSYTADYDYGCVKLEKKKVGNTVGWFGMRWNDSLSTLTDTYVYVAGYRDGLKYDTGYINDADRNKLYYTMDTLPGTSGGPIFDSDDYAIGINIAQNDSYNTGYRINDDVLECYYSVE